MRYFCVKNYTQITQSVISHQDWETIERAVSLSIMSQWNWTTHRNPTTSTGLPQPPSPPSLPVFKSPKSNYEAFVNVYVARGPFARNTVRKDRVDGANAAWKQTYKKDEAVLAAFLTLHQTSPFFQPRTYKKNSSQLKLSFGMHVKGLAREKKAEVQTRTLLYGVVCRICSLRICPYSALLSLSVCPCRKQKERGSERQREREREKDLEI